MKIGKDLYEFVVRIVEERVSDIKVMREDFYNLTRVVENLALRTSELAEAQSRTEKRVEELAEAQRKTEIAVKDLAVQVGRLSDNVGYGLEDVAKVVLPGYLDRHFKIKVAELDRRFLPWKKDFVEVNLYGEGSVDGEQIVVLGEVKARIYQVEVKAFLQELDKIAHLFSDKKMVKVLFGYLVHPSAIDIARKHEVLLVSSYQR